MNIGLMWFNNDPMKTRNTKIDEAADFYQKKYGIRPNLAWVNPVEMPDGAVNTTPGGVNVKISRSIIPNNYWIGMSG